MTVCGTEGIIVWVVAVISLIANAFFFGFLQKSKQEAEHDNQA